MNSNIKLFIAGIFIGIIFFYSIVFTYKVIQLINEGVVEQNKSLCMQYANRSHEKEFTPSRWLLVKQMGWTSEMWYKACMDNINEVVAK